LRACTLAQHWYARDVVTIARELLGKHVRHGGVTLRITETEAYLGPHDQACHTSKGRTPRTEPMWGPPGHAYVYICYGMHVMLNVVCGEQPGSAVLIRACEPVAGLATMQRRRGGMAGPILLTGPGKVGQALGISTKFSGRPLFSGALQVLEGVRPEAILVGTRIGLDTVRPRDRDALLRFACADTPWVSHRGKFVKSASVRQH
jgi:DNA-3-methyladenine glycosylase